MKVIRTMLRKGDRREFPTFNGKYDIDIGIAFIHTDVNTVMDGT